jgi:hypothetical protein
MEDTNKDIQRGEHTMKDVEYGSMVHHISTLIGMKQYLSYVFDAVKTNRLTKEEFVNIVIAVESNSFTYGIEYAQDRNELSERYRGKSQ